MTFLTSLTYIKFVKKFVIHRSHVKFKKCTYTTQSSHDTGTFCSPQKKIHNGLYVPLTKLENTYYGTSKVGPVHAKEAYEEVEAQPHSFLT